MKQIKAYAIVMDDGFIPDFNTEKMEDVYQIHSVKKSAQDFLKKLDCESWKVVPAIISFEKPIK